MDTDYRTLTDDERILKALDLLNEANSLLDGVPGTMVACDAIKSTKNALLVQMLAK